MTSGFFKRAMTVLAMNERGAQCIYRGETLRREKKTCCGAVEIFRCSKLEREVWDSKCRSCEHFAESAGLGRYRRLVLTNYQSPGDILMLTAAVRDLHRAFPGRYQVDVRTSCGQLWDSNPHVTRFPEPWIEEAAQQARDARPALPIVREDIAIIPCDYPLVHKSNQRDGHFISAFHDSIGRALGLEIPVSEFKPDIHLADVEKQWMSQIAEMGVHDAFWLVVTGGKWDATAKWPNPKTLQQVVDYFGRKLLFVQAGDNANWHPLLSGVVDLVGQTDLRMLIRLIWHAKGLITPVTCLMHLAAALDKPCVVIAGGREPTHWEAYPTHRYLSTQGALKCCTPGACWKSRSTPVGDGDGKDSPESLCQNYVELPAPVSPLANRKLETIRIPKCIDMISADDIIRAVASYHEGGVCEFLA